MRNTVRPTATLFERATEAQRELGPALPPAWLVAQQAREIGVLARRAAGFANEGELRLALRQFDSIRAVLGEAEGGAHCGGESGIGPEILADDDMGGAIDG